MSDETVRAQVAANLANWDERASLHAAREGSGYRTQRYVDDPQLLSDVVIFDRPRLGDIAGMRAVHLQCHIGTDTISLARLGARVTGLDFAPAAIAEARRLAADTASDVDFVQADMADAADVLPAGGFDLVYTGIGAICWLPDIRLWGRTVARLLAPGGVFFMREGHPILWSMDERQGDDLHLRFAYFGGGDALTWDDDQSYVDTAAPLTSTRTYEWHRSLGEVVMALIDAGLVLDLLVEHDSVPWLALPAQMVERPDGEFALDALAGVAPLSYTIRARKPA